MKIERLLVVGDIHGQWDKFQSLFAKVRFNPERDLMVFLGDYLDRGDKPVPLMDFILAHQDTKGMIFLRGNHEQMFLDAHYAMPAEKKGFWEWLSSPRQMWLDNGGRVTCDKIKESGRGEALTRAWIEWVERLPLCTELSAAGKTYWFMHADCDPGLPLSKQDQNVLLWGRSLANHPELHQGEMVIVLGHTPVQYLGYAAKPQWLNHGRLVLMDTGSYCPDGCVSCADLLSRTIYQSD